MGDLPEEIDSIVPGGGKFLASSLGFFMGNKAGAKKTVGHGRTPRKKREKKEGGGSLISTIKNFFGGGKSNTSPGGTTTHSHRASGHSKNSSKSFTEMDFTPFKGQMTVQGRHSRQPSAEMLNL